jgi:hypothetical protein
MQYRFNFVEYKKGDEEYRLDYDLQRSRFFYKEKDDSFVFKQCASIEEFKETIEGIKKEWEDNGYKSANEGFSDDTEALIMQKIFDKVEKDNKSNTRVKKEENPYKNKNQEDLKKEYFNIAGSRLPKILSDGFVKALQKYKKAGNDEDEICCILDIKDKSKMIFVYGDGGDCEGAGDENVFFVYTCDGTLNKCKSMVEAIETLNLRQESSHWLTDAINIAAEQGVLKGLSITIYGNVQFGDIELDVLYES